MIRFVCVRLSRPEISRASLNDDALIFDHYAFVLVPILPVMRRRSHQRFGDVKAKRLRCISLFVQMSSRLSKTLTISPSFVKRSITARAVQRPWFVRLSLWQNSALMSTTDKKPPYGEVFSFFFGMTRKRMPAAIPPTISSAMSF
jgi:hypothetical protein